MGCIIERDGRFYLRIRIDGKIIQRGIHDPANGRRAETRAQAERLGAIMAADLTSGGKIGLFETSEKKRHRVTIAEVNEKYLEAFASRWDRARRGDWDDFMQIIQGTFAYVDEINHASLGKHVQKRLSTPKERGGGQRTPARINRELSAIKRLLNWAHQTGLIEKNPFIGFPLLREDNRRERILSPDETRRLLSAIRDSPQPIRGIVAIALYGGLRKGEILSLKWSDQAEPGDNALDLKNGKIDLQRTKSGQRRTIDIPGPLQHEIQLIPRTDESPWVFPSRDDPAQPLGEFRKSLAALLKKAGIVGFRFHDFRHSAASNLLRSGADIETVRRILGHADISTTAKYLESHREDRQSALEAAADMLGAMGSMGGDAADQQPSRQPDGATNSKQSGKPDRPRIRRPKSTGK